MGEVHALARLFRESKLLELQQQIEATRKNLREKFGHAAAAGLSALAAGVTIDAVFDSLEKAAPVEAYALPLALLATAAWQGYKGITAVDELAVLKKKHARDELIVRFMD
ncbi:MAG: hypothetical protein GC136_04740 [Alphaproteobacteria bacterium]|nr:hypothetical protein [Alphaproteobacteria bacterium]